MSYKNIKYSWSEPSVFIPEGKNTPYDRLPKAYHKALRKIKRDELIARHRAMARPNAIGSAATLALNGHCSTLWDYINWVLARRRDREMRLVKAS